MVLEKIAVLKELTIFSVLLRTVLAMVFSGILGYEREKKGRPAGFRTYMVVCIGSEIAMMTGIFLSRELGSTDPSRIAAQVISGIGFLGAGTILVTRQNQVKGLTTAAGLWAAACMGNVRACRWRWISRWKIPTRLKPMTRGNPPSRRMAAMPILPC